jgi:hypothetical protein
MPSASDKQARAMRAAAHGNSTLGIPKAVGKEFVQADKKSSTADVLAKSVKAPAHIGSAAKKRRA